MAPEPSVREPDELHGRWLELKAAAPGLRTRDGAQRLGVSECELIASAPSSLPLAGDFGALIGQLPGLGPLLALTRNEAVVIEKTGRFEEVELYPESAMAQVVGEAIDLRLFLRHWVHGIAVTENVRQGPRRSLQFFDARGTAVHKLYEQRDSDAAALTALVERFRAGTPEGPRPAVEVEPAAPPPPPRPDADIDVAGLRAAWLALTNTHEFHGLLRRFDVARPQALRLAGSDLAQPVARDSYRRVLTLARERRLPLMIFVGNRGTVQIHSGPVRRIETVGDWFNVVDPGFNLHVFEPAMVDAWIVRKPTARGIVTSLECFDQDGDLALQTFGLRKGDTGEPEAWRELIADLSTDLG